jgi:hypothetical protein
MVTGLNEINASSMILLSSPIPVAMSNHEQAWKMLDIIKEKSVIAYELMSNKLKQEISLHPDKDMVQFSSELIQQTGIKVKNTSSKPNVKHERTDEQKSKDRVHDLIREKYLVRNVNIEPIAYLGYGWFIEILTGTKIDLTQLKGKKRFTLAELSLTIISSLPTIHPVPENLISMTVNFLKKNGPLLKQVYGVLQEYLKHMKLNDFKDLPKNHKLHGLRHILKTNSVDFNFFLQDPAKPNVFKTKEGRTIYYMSEKTLSYALSEFLEGILILQGDMLLQMLGISPRIYGDIINNIYEESWLARCFIIYESFKGLGGYSIELTRRKQDKPARIEQEQDKPVSKDTFVDQKAYHNKRKKEDSTVVEQKQVTEVHTAVHKVKPVDQEVGRTKTTRREEEDSTVIEQDLTTTVKQDPHTGLFTTVPIKDDYEERTASFRRSKFATPIKR